MIINANVAASLNERLGLRTQGFNLRGPLKFEPDTRIWNAGRIQTVQIGKYSSISPKAVLVRTSLGRYCSIGHRVEIGMSRHPVDWLTSSAAIYKPGLIAPTLQAAHCEFDDQPQETIIGHDVWVGAHALIPGGIRIGTGAIVAAGSVVTKSVPPYAIVGGNPARLIKYRFDEPVIAALLETKWWQYDLLGSSHYSDIKFDDPAAALATIDRLKQEDEIHPLKETWHRIYARGNKLYCE